MNESVLGKIIGYTRVSPVEQSADRQLDGIHLDRIFEERVSAKTTSRPRLEEMLNYIRDGDVVIVQDMSRLARSVQDLQALVEQITSKGASLRFVKEELSFTSDESDSMNAVLLSVLAAINQFERALMKERQKEGIAAAKAKGKFKGRRPTIDNDEILRLVSQGKSIAQTAAILGVSKSSVQRAKRQQRQTAKDLIGRISEAVKGRFFERD